MGIPTFPSPSEFAREIHLSLDHAAITANGTAKMWKNKTGRNVRVRALAYVNGTGLAADNTNAFSASVKRGSDTVATLFNTDGNDDPVGAAIVANTWIDGVLSATDSDLILEPDDELDLVFVEDGTATLPAGRLVFAGLIV